MFKILNETASYLPQLKPRYSWGYALRYFRAVKEGIDMFDCVMPTRSGRTGLAFTWNGKVNLKIQSIKMINLIDEGCDIKELNKYSKSYLNHLIKLMK